ncbi:MAG: TadE/TadG family type IV pilus assembly protein [Pseudomonadota bacterium]|uniref:TadE/TadG family type IV pilus assembly protein n=1 Tax=Roseovarius TaxID=74030 RepID=UPI0022A67560|nr:pilus assembly protein [Roseovarius sp. EGI FJ00037]MCZ0811751.1 pilus assembly protein [Roseovarius sp. EGI FJ00037]
MLIARMKSFLARFRDCASGTVTVETVVIVPILFWTLSATFEFFEMYRYKSVREKASYTIVDMISREQTSVSASYIDNTKTLFDDFTNDFGENQMRVSIITYNSEDDEYAIVWSEVRGDGPLDELTDASVKTRHDILPIMGNGEHLIQIESYSEYEAHLSVGFSDSIPMQTRVFTSPRFAEQVKCPDC